MLVTTKPAHERKTTQGHEITHKEAGFSVWHSVWLGLGHSCSKIAAFLSGLFVKGQEERGSHCLRRKLKKADMALFNKYLKLLKEISGKEKQLL